MTSAIARMNCFLHGVEDFQIVRGDTLSEPKFVEGDRLQRFDVVLANPPYSIKQWNRDAFASDPWGRNFSARRRRAGPTTPSCSTSCAASTPKTGRCAILFPHGVLFRKEEAEMRRKLIEADLIECVLGLGPNLFYNSPMEACVVICRTAKPKSAQGQDPVHQRRERSHPRTRPELSHRRPHRAHRRSLRGVQGRTWLRPRRDAGGDPRQGRQPEHPALRPHRLPMDRYR